MILQILKEMTSLPRPNFSVATYHVISVALNYIFSTQICHTKVVENFITAIITLLYAPSVLLEMCLN